MRIELIVEYLGFGYGGYQRQKNAVTIQQKLEEAYLSLTGERVTMSAAGRTDAGVSARNQHVHFDTRASIPPGRISYAMNTRLPGDIRVKLSREAEEGFNARFCARAKTYRYTIWNAPHASAIYSRLSWHVPGGLNIEAMKRAAGYMEGKHDFRAFMAAGSEAKTFERTVERIDIDRRGEAVLITVNGDGFLYNMVRIMAGTLVCVGKEKLDADDVPGIILSLQRKNAGPTAPPHGLMLMDVYY